MYNSRFGSKISKLIGLLCNCEAMNVAVTEDIAEKVISEAAWHCLWELRQRYETNWRDRCKCTNMSGRQKK